MRRTAIGKGLEVGTVNRHRGRLQFIPEGGNYVYCSCGWSGEERDPEEMEREWWRHVTPKSSIQSRKERLREYFARRRAKP